MKKNFYLFFAILISWLFMQGCQDVKDWSDPTDDIPPGPISNPIVTNLHGSTMITYTLPSDNDLLGVKAVYSLSSDDEERFVFSSAFTDTIFVDGFPDTKERVVKLIALDKSLNESEPVSVVVNPLIPAVFLIDESKYVSQTFGGVFVSWDNPTREYIGVELSYKDSLGIWVHDYTYYTNAAVGEYQFRGFDDTEREFRVRFLDNWGRAAEPYEVVLKPLFEEWLNPLDEFGNFIFTRYGADNGSDYWRGDFPAAVNRQGNPAASQGFWDAFKDNPTNMWNVCSSEGNIIGQWTGDLQNDILIIKPIYKTIDLHSVVYLSRLTAWHWRTRMLMGWAPLHIEIWGSLEPPAPVDKTGDLLESIKPWVSWEYFGGTDEWKKDWTFLIDCWFIPPSGTTDLNLATDEDKEWTTYNGWDFPSFPECTSIPVRYLRIVIESTWNPTGVGCQLCSWRFYGQKLD